MMVFNQQNQPSHEVSLCSPFTVRLQYDINEEVDGAHIICFFYTEDGVNVFGTGDGEKDPDRMGVRQPGRYTTEFEVPAYLLGEGLYYITVSLSIPFKTVFDRHDRLAAFTVIDDCTTRKQWLSKRRPGVLGIELPWKVQIETSEAEK